MKKCCYCKDYKSLDDFSSPKQGACKLCVKEYNKNYRAKTLVKRARANKEWRQNNKEHQKERQYNYYATIKGRIQNCVKGAKKRAGIKKIPYDISIEFIAELWSKQDGKCALTRIDFSVPQERNDRKASPFSPSIDRIDCSKGYTKDNVRLVCIAVNYALNEFGEEVFKIICQSYLDNMVFRYDDFPIQPT